MACQLWIICRKGVYALIILAQYVKRIRSVLTHGLISYDFALFVWALWQECLLSLLLETRDFRDLALHFHENSPLQHLEFFFAIS